MKSFPLVRQISKCDLSLHTILNATSHELIGDPTTLLDEEKLKPVITQAVKKNTISPVLGTKILGYDVSVKEGIIEFNKDSKGFLLLQEIRDESHRFAINAQRKKKNAKNRKSQLDNIEGIGEILKKRLLLNFKSLKNIKSANIEELMTVKGINVKIAQLIKEKL